VKKGIKYFFILLFFVFVGAYSFIKSEIDNRQVELDNLNGNVSANRSVVGVTNNGKVDAVTNQDETNSDDDYGITIAGETDPKIQEESLRNVLRNKGNLADLLSYRIAYAKEEKKQDSSYQIDPKYLRNYVDVDFLNFGADENTIEVRREEIEANVILTVEENGEKHLLNAEFDFAIRQKSNMDRLIVLRDFILSSDDEENLDSQNGESSKVSEEDHENIDSLKSIYGEEKANKIIKLEPLITQYILNKTGMKPFGVEFSFEDAEGYIFYCSPANDDSDFYIFVNKNTESIKKIDSDEFNSRKKKAIGIINSRD
jgi:hypothetical protein